MSGDGTADPSVMADLCRSYGLDGPAVALDRLRDEVDDLRTAADIASINAKADDALIRRLRGLLARALPWIDPNDSHEDYLLTVEIRKALGEGT